MNNNTIKPQLFLLHFGGGNCYSYQFMRLELEKYFQFIPLELPGRGKRFGEELLFSNKQAVIDYLKQIRSMRNRAPYMIYGHSMGATLGLEVVYELEQLGDSPRGLVVTGNAGPNVKSKTRKTLYLLNDFELKEELRAMGGVPEEVLENEELFNFFSPILRADFEVLEKVDNNPIGRIINTPIVAAMGDLEETSVNIENWKNYTRGEFKFKVFKGNHFFIHDNSVELTKLIAQGYDRSLLS